MYILLPIHLLILFSEFPQLTGFFGSKRECLWLYLHSQDIAEDMFNMNLVRSDECIASRPLLSVDDILKSASTGCVPELSSYSVDCTKSFCYHLYFRTLDGVCNNLDGQYHGNAFHPYMRHLPPEYDAFSKSKARSTTKRRPTSEKVLEKLLLNSQVIGHDKYNALIMQFGQFISHELSQPVILPSDICSSCRTNISNAKCMVVDVSPNDPTFKYKKDRCFKISRSASVCGEISREQLNENTPFIDASTVYGSSWKDLKKFRDGQTAFLKMQRFKQQILLPFDENLCLSLNNCTATFIAGDKRVSMFPGLSSLHILFAREHNRLASILYKMNSDWSNNRIFQEARKILGAELQVITYQEYLPKLLGIAFKHKVGPYKGYDSTVNPLVSNVFAAAAFRFGHGMLQDFYPRLDANFSNSLPGYSFSNAVHNIGNILYGGGIDPILRGLMLTPVKKPHGIMPAITHKMFRRFDLGTTNVLQGRDHGIPSYNKWREFCGRKYAKDFSDFSREISDPEIRRRLSQVYDSPNDVDLSVGGMLEDPVTDGLIGPTLACLIGDQFKRARDGDRFYYENPGIFTQAQQKEIRKASLARLICDNGDNFDKVPKDAFLYDDKGFTSCSNLPQLDLTAWMD